MHLFLADPCLNCLEWEITGGLLEITGDYTTHFSCMLSSPRIGRKLDRPSMQEVATVLGTPPVFQN